MQCELHSQLDHGIERTRKIQVIGEKAFPFYSLLLIPLAPLPYVKYPLSPLPSLSPIISDRLITPPQRPPPSPLSLSISFTNALSFLSAANLSIDKLARAFCVAVTRW